jgi:hypothetical protein
LKIPAKIWVARFELATSTPPALRATRLHYTQSSLMAVETVGIEPTTKTLQRFFAPLVHAPPALADVWSNIRCAARGRGFTRAITYVLQPTKIGEPGFEPRLFLAPNQVPYQIRRFSVPVQNDGVLDGSSHNKRRTSTSLSGSSPCSILAE